ncbi:hypothetical protein HEP86_19725 [Streptomyces sp. RPA4-5]|uniref:hypothetical protein n=1 Tax=Streptomyces sp. RPA4-5 TaxID=2721245 RepID=UPI00143ED602|nr:hypothetical protein [Streptomyces sp. RPA4-5]QIY56346.1 hypothetical protein HEP86_19725 [Streptomyces sp. RPA4-5]
MPEEPQQKVDESEFLEITQDPAAARLLRKSLEAVAAGGAGEALKEMAQEVLSGRVGFRQAMEISAYSDQLVEQVHAATEEKWDSLSEKERDALAAEGQKVLEKQRQELDEERQQTQVQGQRPPTSSRHSGGWSLH